MKVDPTHSADENGGETKREKAFWQVYCAIISANSDNEDELDACDAASIAMLFVDIGFAELNKEQS